MFLYRRLFFQTTVQIEDELEMMETKRINGEKLKELKKIALNQEKDIEDNKNEQKQKERMEIPDEEQKIILSELIFELQMVKTSLLVADSHRLGFKIGTYIYIQQQQQQKGKYLKKSAFKFSVTFLFRKKIFIYNYQLHCSCVAFLLKFFIEIT